ncbi:helix-turn-helix domain-containing protein [Streptomyces uncialis]|uniref:helix-turn-helix domain-containing protein n=1 Tax=Streptomyces uncialis TaxID=1048205 RepID=UPI0022530D18|nr:helix-turn-helix domain-containing protein [Streptomyces uncialis]MCX4663692.1 helix-turn-helix domain-containing protein [Streptomyces uncialis]
MAIVPQNTEVTVQQAAGLLNVSRPWLDGLLEAGEIGSRMVSGRRRVLLGSVREYRDADDARRRAAAEELTRRDEEMGLLL